MLGIKGYKMNIELSIVREEDGSFTAMLTGVGDAGIIVSARSPGNNTPELAMSRAAHLFSLNSPLFGLGQSVDDRNNISVTTV